MTYSIDDVFFQELAERDPNDVCRRALCRYDDVKQRYLLTAWGDDFAVYPNQFNIKCLSKNNVQESHEYFYLFMVHFLLHAKEIDTSEEWISEKDIPGGAAFFCGPHAIPTHLMTAHYKNDIEAFNKNCRQLGGIPLDMADASYGFKIAPRIPVAALYWEGDDEFPPESKLLFDKSISEHLALDIIFALAVDVCARIGSL